ncbi:2-succinyl-5-enolpyruvyl-6-hydroxy-3-cyclohexene-1-carboxylic-acid synthase [Virgibacillus senegalensis]|uniref:2-succinyl-5-enolpyruvyl-6-hydroxy-3- cyclohexene-1-carboxylic-acid synthase n=1 Tax=Virgibacillus senegalensis TaxID=1499679 RepID=UPI00069F140A|nr:2-succinyl-5-enolpyruvyl-6-hydroxy-3-cyclohexene-1-carboxylic-acid synthase [Virgibacillus senegalensis]
MSYTEALTRYTANFVDELYQNGLKDVVISPGSRSTPLAVTFAEHPHIQHWVNMDERSAAFFALGMAKQQNKPVAIVCTSGTAAANYFPAIVEAYYSRVPLVVLTADRPHELRDVGAPQAIEQIGMYGKYVKWFQEMALPEQTPAMLQYGRSKAARAYHTAFEGNPGPVHLNFPYREPLMPDFSLDNIWGTNKSMSFHETFTGEKRLDSHQLDKLLEQLAAHQKGLLVCGPQFDTQLAEAICGLAEKWQIPLLADPLSQLRAGQHAKTNMMESYDTILKSKQVRDRLHPDFIIRFGAMPVSKPYLLFVKEHPEMEHFVVESSHGYREPAGTAAQFVYADPIRLCQDLMDHEEAPAYDQQWLETWKAMNKTAKAQLLEENPDSALTEGHTVKQLAEAMPEQSTIFVGNSMPIRDMDTFFMATPKSIRVLGNRGANGIDGTTSSALGAAAHGEKVTLLSGDVTFFHDLTGLMSAKQYQLNLTVVLINNNGGGIFSFLPQAGQTGHFETIFGTPLDMDFQYVSALYEGKYVKPETWDDLRQALAASYQHNGLSIIEVQTNRQENVEWHRKKWDDIERRLLDYLGR